MCGVFLTEPGGAVAARNFAAAGLRTVVLEAGPQIAPEDMTRDGPGFMSQYMWDGGLRIIQAKSPVPIMQGRCLGGSTVMNSAIMLKIPDWVRQDWSRSNGLHWLEGPELDAAFERIFEGTRTAPTPMSVMGPRNRVVQKALAAAGQPGKALPRAVHNCEGCADCLVGCASGAKQSTDRSYIPYAVKDGARVYTCAHVENIEMEGTRAVGVTGRVVDQATTTRRRLRPYVRLPDEPGAHHLPRPWHQGGVQRRRTRPPRLRRSGAKGGPGGGP